MLKKKKTTASGKLVLVKSVRRTRSLHRHDAEQMGFGHSPTSILQSKIAFV